MRASFKFKCKYSVNAEAKELVLFRFSRNSTPQSSNSPFYIEVVHTNTTSFHLTCYLILLILNGFSYPQLEAAALPMFISQHFSFSIASQV